GVVDVDVRVSSYRQSTQRLGQVDTSDQDDLTCLSWLHQRGDLLPLQPLAKMTLLPQQQVCTPGHLPPPPPSVSSKPPYSFSSLIFMAIEDSPQKRLPVKDIYEWIVSNFPYYRTATGGWRNSVRHNLSLSKSFRRIQRDKSQSVGKGSLWCVCPEYRPALLEVLRKTHSYHSTSTSLCAFLMDCSSLSGEKQHLAAFLSHAAFFYHAALFLCLFSVTVVIAFYQLSNGATACGKSPPLFTPKSLNFTPKCARYSI
uniref:Si:ch211-145o7.3 n=1 Tax=Fundulus heteroclitus TaxID=8078 RepID=A0A3Q2PMJ5_FUNHE